MKKTRELTEEEEQVRKAVFQCLACGNGMVVGQNYPPAMPIPRTLELWCVRCHVNNILYQPKYWSKEEAA